MYLYITLNNDSLAKNADHIQDGKEYFCIIPLGKYLFRC